MNIRMAEKCDLEGILDIYNYEIENGIATFDAEKKTMTEWKLWFERHSGEGPATAIVAEENGEILGYASLSAYRDRRAYNSTLELSVYVKKEYRNKGVATELMNEIIKIARVDPRVHAIVSVITSGNKASIKLHEKFGFAYCGTIREVGFKFGRYLNVDNYELIV